MWVTPSRARTTLSLVVYIALATSFNLQANPYLDQLSPNARAEFQSTPGLATINAQYAYARGLDGRGQVLGLIDTGVHMGHPELAGRVFGVIMRGLDKAGNPCQSSRYVSGDKACFLSDGQPFINYQVLNSSTPPGQAGRENPKITFDSHGTHGAGTMVAARDGKGVQGVAPEAKVLSATFAANAYTPLGPQGSPVEDKILAVNPTPEALESGYAALRQANVRAINNSRGLTNSPSESMALMDEHFKNYAAEIKPIADATLKSGVIQVWAAGNTDGAMPDVLASLPHYIPALQPYWLSVISASADGKLDEFSSRCGPSRQWCIAAPGDNILSTVVKGVADAKLVREQGRIVGIDVATQQRPVSDYAKYFGTSAAAPHVTASLALLMQRFPYLNNAGIRDVLLTTARDLGAPGVDDIFGWGMVDLRKAIEGPGQLRVDMTVNMDRPGGGTPVWRGPAWDDWRNAIGGSGRLIKQGPGWLRLSGNNRFGGATVDGGTLEFAGDNALAAAVAVNSGGNLHVSGRMAGSAIDINGGHAWIGGRVSAAPVHVRQGGRLQLAESGRIEGGGLRLSGSQASIDGQVAGRVDIDVGSRLEGNGQLGPTWLAGTIAPGHSIGRLTIAGDYVQQPGSVYEAEVDPSGRSDLLQVQGRAHLQGGTLRVVPTSAGAMLGQRWRVLAASSVSGQFSAVEAALRSPFLAMAARYSIDAVDAQVARGLPLASAARTANQRSVAAAVDGTHDAHALPQRLTQLQPAQVPAALDPLSGELHASVRSLLLQDSRWVRDTALARTRNSRDAFSAQSAAGTARGPWMTIHQGQSRLDGDGNADTAVLSGSATLLGYDHTFGQGWQLGLFGGAGRSHAQVRTGRDRAEIRATHAGLHLSRHWTHLSASAGLANSWQDLRSRRQVPAGAEAGTTSAQARYDVTTTQWFTELAYRIERAQGGIEPFLQYAGLRLRTDGSREQGGEAPLEVAPASQSIGLWTGGLRFGLDLAARGQAQRWLSLRGSLAYQRAHGDLTPTAQLQWQQGPGFSVSGIPLAKRSTLASLGVAARLSERSLLELDWRGAFASHAQDHGLSARYSLRF